MRWATTECDHQTQVLPLQFSAQAQSMESLTLSSQVVSVKSSYWLMGLAAALAAFSVLVATACGQSLRTHNVRGGAGARGASFDKFYPELTWAVVAERGALEEACGAAAARTELAACVQCESGLVAGMIDQPERA